MPDIRDDFEKAIQGWDRSYVTAIFNPPSPRSLTDADKAVRAQIVCDLYAMGHSARQIGVAIGYSYQWVFNTLNEYGQKVRPWPGIQPRRQAGVLGG